MPFQSASTVFAALSLNDTNHPLVAFPVSPFNGAFFGQFVAFNQQVEFNFEAGEAPVLLVGCPAGQVLVDPFDSRFTIVGYLVDCTNGGPC